MGGEVALWKPSSPHLTSPYLNSVASWEIPIHPIQICNAILTPLTSQPASNDARSINTPRLCNLEDLDDPGAVGWADGYEMEDWRYAMRGSLGISPPELATNPDEVI